MPARHLSWMERPGQERAGASQQGGLFGTRRNWGPPSEQVIRRLVLFSERDRIAHKPVVEEYPNWLWSRDPAGPRPDSPHLPRFLALCSCVREGRGVSRRMAPPGWGFLCCLGVGLATLSTGSLAFMRPPAFRPLNKAAALPERPVAQRRFARQTIVMMPSSAPLVRLTLSEAS